MPMAVNCVCHSWLGGTRAGHRIHVVGVTKPGSSEDRGHPWEAHYLAVVERVSAVLVKFGTPQSQRSGHACPEAHSVQGHHRTA